jgi:hypothetical protein
MTPMMPLSWNEWWARVAEAQARGERNDAAVFLDMVQSADTWLLSPMESKELPKLYARCPEIAMPKIDGAVLERTLRYLADRGVLRFDRG